MRAPHEYGNMLAGHALGMYIYKDGEGNYTYSGIWALDPSRVEFPDPLDSIAINPNDPPHPKDRKFLGLPLPWARYLPFIDGDDRIISDYVIMQYDPNEDHSRVYQELADRLEGRVIVHFNSRFGQSRGSEIFTSKETF